MYCVTQRHTCRTATYAQDQNPKLTVATGDHEQKEVTHPPTDTHRDRCAHTETYKQDKNSGHPSDQPSPVEHDQKVVTHTPLRVHRIVRTGAECSRTFQRGESSRATFSCRRSRAESIDPHFHRYSHRPLCAHRNVHTAMYVQEQNKAVSSSDKIDEPAQEHLQKVVTPSVARTQQRTYRSRMQQKLPATRLMIPRYLQLPQITSRR